MADQVKKTAAKPKKPADHPKYIEMIIAAITSLKERSGSSRQAILKYIVANYKVGDNANVQLKLALKRGVAAGTLAQPKGTGASGSFKVVKKAEPAKKKPATKKKTAAAAKKPAAKKPTPKKKKSTAKKSATPKKTKKPAAAKKTSGKKTPAKKPAKKPAAKKPAAKKVKKTPKKKTAGKSKK